jgi:hypothetical protein
MLAAIIGVSISVTGCASADPSPESAAAATASVQQAYEDSLTPTPLATSTPSAACDSWIARAASFRTPGGPVDVDVASALRNAVRNCPSTDQFATAVRNHPSVMGSAGLTTDQPILDLLTDTCHLWNASDDDALTCRDAELRHLIDWTSSDNY